jgi:hypothetical protein
MDDDIPQLLPPEQMPRVLTQTDLHRHWRALMGELGFGYSRLYLQFIGIDGRAEPFVPEIAELPDLPDSELTEALMRICAELLDRDLEPGTRVAVLYARPGGRAVTRADRAWGRSLTDAAQRVGVPIWQVHLANDEQLTVLAPDDLVQPA